MQKKVLRKSLTILLCQTLVFSPLLRANQLLLPSGDITAPTITQERYIDKAEHGADHEITVTVTDDNIVKQVTLYYRSIGSQEYQQLTMNKVVNTDNYHITLLSDIIKAPGLEYYVQAMDNAGNLVLHGYSFSPLSVKTDTNATVLASASSNAKIEVEESSSMWTWIGIGALVVVGFLVSRPDDDKTGSDDTATLTINTNNP